ncbi:EpsG family protein [Shewanella xiamenensis]|uniref:EpsG family protein n=1 Tax=Shewanella xiamenensis TaxID=332186 RepID=UPI003B004784
MKTKVLHLLDTLFFILLFFLAWLLYGGNQWNGDRDAYELYYVRDSIYPWGVEILYGYLNIIFNNFGFPFQTFQVIISFFTLFFTGLYLKHVSRYVAISFLVYFLLMFPLDYVLMRTSLSYAIVLNALILLFRNRKSLFVLLIIIATLIHQSAIFFLIFLLANNRDKKNSILFYFLMSISLAFVFQSLIAQGLVPTKLIEHFSYYKTNWITIFSCIFYHVLSVFLIRLNFSLKKIKSNYDYFILNLNIVSLVLIIAYFQSDIFVRSFRLIVFVNLIYFIQYVFLSKKINLFSAFYIGFYSFYLVSYYIYPVADDSFVPLFSKSYFF